MEASEAAEIIRTAGEATADQQHVLQFNRVAALFTAVLAALLAVASIGTGATTRTLLNTNIHVADIRSDTDVVALHQFQSQGSADLLQSLIEATNPSADARASIAQRISAYQAEATQLEGDAQAGTGIRGGEARVTTLERQEATSEARILSFEFSEVALQIGIVLTSVAILTQARALFYACCGLGVVGALLLLNGLTLFTRLTILH